MGCLVFAVGGIMDGGNDFENVVILSERKESKDLRTYDTVQQDDSA